MCTRRIKSNDEANDSVENISGYRKEGRFVMVFFISSSSPTGALNPGSNKFTTRAKHLLLGFIF
jgi:hypothetical protein